jgi:predicted dithiol-disulfide oxidoreductase (DUF899 family)
MTRHMTGTRDEWLAARLELLKAEKELTRRRSWQDLSPDLLLVVPGKR